MKLVNMKLDNMKLVNKKLVDMKLLNMKLLNMKLVKIGISPTLSFCIDSDVAEKQMNLFIQTFS